MEVVVVDYGAGNTRSVCAALQRLGHRFVVTSDPRAISGSEYVILPGVGSARSAMSHLTNSGATAALRQRFADHDPMLGICLGMQLAVTWSDEDGGVGGLDLFPGRVHRLDGQRVPRLGWCMVEPLGEAMYFAHSYSVTSASATHFSDSSTAIVENGSFLGCQFHPEKSGDAGLTFLERCLSLA